MIRMPSDSAFTDDAGIYPIGVIAKMLGVHPETLRVWERHQIVEPHRENNQRRYSNNDLKRLQFVLFLIEEKGLNLAGVKQVVDLYPCWSHQKCRGARRSSELKEGGRPCWLELGTYCYAEGRGDWCAECEHYQECRSCQKMATNK